MATDILSRSIPEPNSGCWIWEGALDKDGYGVAWSGNTVRAHRLSFEQFVGKIGSGLVIDHKCRNRCCVNPKHLEPVSSRENTFRGETSARKNSLKTHCPKGHEYSGNNLLAFASGRQCRECGRERARAYQKKKRDLHEANELKSNNHV